MKIGTTLETAMWLSGEESQETLDRYYKDVCEAFLTACTEAGFVHGPVAFYELQPGEDRVPEVPDHIQGQSVRLLVAETDVIAKMPELKTYAFVGDLEHDDLQRLRQITRRRMGQHLTDFECDDIIEEHGPEAAVAALQQAVNGQTTH